MNGMYLITADLHLRHDKPRCRVDDDWIATQQKMLSQIREIALDYAVSGVIIAGDVFHRWKETPELENMFIGTLSVDTPVYIMPGQHDLMGHSMYRIFKSSFGVMWAHAVLNMDSENGILPMQSLCHWRDFQKGEMFFADKSSDVLCLHKLVTPNDSMLPSDEAITASELLDAEESHYKTILAGDYHAKHVYFPGSRSKHHGRCVIVPGCANRQVADAKGYQPSVTMATFIDGFVTEYEYVDLDDDINMIDDGYLKKQEERVSRVSSFIQALKESGEMSLSFEDNVRDALKDPAVTGAVREEIETLMGWSNAE